MELVGSLLGWEGFPGLHSEPLTCFAPSLLLLQQYFESIEFQSDAVLNRLHFGCSNQAWFKFAHLLGINAYIK